MSGVDEKKGCDVIVEYEYIIRITYGIGTGCYLQDYIGNGTYYVQGDRYVVLTNIENAKRYTSEKRAINALLKLSESCCNILYPADKAECVWLEKGTTEIVKEVAI